MVIAQLPTGTVTFLFTDIEDSTAQWEQDRAAMAVAVQRHLQLLLVSISEHGGVHFKTVGDMVQAAFPTAPQAVAAALAGQRALQAENWAPIGTLRVRMALHAGEAMPDDRGDYLAAPLNRLSRLLSTGHGGQILLSQSVQQLTRGGLPPATALRDLGLHRLRDLLEPEHVFQLVHADLYQDFSPLKSLDARPNNLPRQPTPFLGREGQVREIMALLQRQDVHLLTLTGPGGTGKTRLALQVAAELADAFANGVFFVPLAALTDPARVPDAIALALGLRDGGDPPLLQQLQRYLARQELLLVLDNVEHVVDAAPIVGALLEEAPQLKVLATSRVPLRLRAEHEYPVPPLGLPQRKPPPSLEQLSQFESVRLFIERAQAIKPNFAVDNQNAPAIAEICHRLDGLPLAIELAAARTRMIPPDTLLARLEQRLPMLTGGARDAPARQQTLWNTIAWSYDLLQPQEQTLFCRLAVFAGGCALDAADVVGNHDGALDTFEGLEVLGEHSLLRQEERSDGEPRLTMLETIREFGLVQLKSNDALEDVQRRHAEYMATLAKDADAEIHGPEQLRWTERLEMEHENLRVALIWSLAHDPEMALRLVGALFWFWINRGYLAEVRDWTEQALATEASVPPALQARVLNWAAYSAVGRDNSKATARAEKALALARSADDISSEGWALACLGSIARITGNWKQAAALSAEAEACFRRIGERHGVIVTLFDQGVHAESAGNHTQRQEFLEQALAEAQATGDRVEVAWVLNELGYVALEHGHLDRARTIFEEALVMAQELRYDQVEVSVLLGLAEVVGLQGDTDQSATYMLQGETKYRDPRFRPLLADFLRASSYVELRSGNYERARDLVSEALAVARELSSPSIVAEMLNSLGDTLRVGKDLVGAAQHYREALVLALELEDVAVITSCLTGFAGLAIDTSHYEEAARLFGTVEMLRETVRLQTSFYAAQVVSRDEARLREALGADADRQARAVGRGLSVDAAANEALQLADRVTTSAAVRP